MNLKELNEILEIRKEEIRNGEYSYSFYKNLNSCWNNLITYLNNNNLLFNEETKQKFLEMEKENISPKRYFYVIHAINAIDGLDNIIAHKSNIINNTKSLYNHSEENIKLINLYLKEIEDYSSKRTYNDKEKTIHEIVSYLEKIGLDNCNNLTRDEIIKVREYYLNFQVFSKKRRFQWILKDFIRFLFNNGNIKTDFSLLFDNLKRGHKDVLKVWSKEEIEKIVDNLECDTPIKCRNKAIVLLAIRLGIRIVDIKNLSFENINWEENKICFTQQKTGEYIELPLIEEVGSAILEYVKTSRPKTNLRYLFVTHDEYAKELTSNTNIIEYLEETYKKAGIDFSSKTRKGIHSFRYALASNMLESGIPLDIISSTLGHSNKNSAKSYLSVGYDLLKECCLEIPEVLR